MYFKTKKNSQTHTQNTQNDRNQTTILLFIQKVTSKIKKKQIKIKRTIFFHILAQIQTKNHKKKKKHRQTKKHQQKQFQKRDENLTKLNKHKM